MIYEAIHDCMARMAGLLWGIGSDRSDKNFTRRFH
jgi:hypothetical protein